MNKLVPILLLCLMPIWAFAQTLTLDGESQTLENVTNTTVTMKGVSELHLTGDNPIDGATINIEGEDAWLFIHGERPSYLISRISQITVNGAAAVDDVNVRVEQYEMGVVLIPHDDNYAGSTLFADANLTGDSLNIKHHTIYKDASGLGTMNNALSSFVLRKGYMMTIAQQINGSGYSKNYVADKEDVIVNELPEALGNEVSFVRVVRWVWATKKGINSTELGDTLDASWYYNWGSGSQSLDDMEFVPMKWGGGNVNENNFINKKNITHQLAFNEPSHSEQSNMSVDAALREYPKLLATGLRAGSPNIADNGKPWLYEFMEKADELNYRVDFVGVHWYKGCQTARQFYTWLKDVHDRTGRPIWVTEFNNGAAWTSENCIPTFEEQATKMASFLEMFDTTSFIERYCVYNWGVETRTLADLNEDKTVNYLHPSGIVYRDQPSPFAYNEDAYYTPIYVELTAPISLSTSVGDNDVLTLTWYDNAYQEDGFSIERSFEGGAYEVIGTVDGEQEYKVTYTDVTRVEYGEYSYRVRTKKGDDYSAYSDVVSSTLDDGIYEICYIQHNESGRYLAADGFGLQMTDAPGTGAEAQWVRIPLSSGYYFIKNLENSYRLYNNDGALVLSAADWTGNHFQWDLQGAGDDYFLLENLGLGQLVWTKADDPSTITFQPTSWNGTKSQWKFVGTGVDYPGEGNAVSDIATSLFSVSPSPCEHTLTIHGLDKEANVKVMSISGQLIFQTTTQQSLDVSQLSQGIYFLQVENSQVLKFLKK